MKNREFKTYNVDKQFSYKYNGKEWELFKFGRVIAKCKTKAEIENELSDAIFETGKYDNR